MEKNDYATAKKIILNKWWDFMDNINDYLPDFGYSGEAKQEYYQFYGMYTNEDIERMHNYIVDFAVCAMDTVMYNHIAHEYWEVLRKVNEAKENNSILEMLKAVWDGFSEFRKTIIVLERITF